MGTPCTWGHWALPRCAHSLRLPWFPFLFEDYRTSPLCLWSNREREASLVLIRVQWLSIVGLRQVVCYWQDHRVVIIVWTWWLATKVRGVIWPVRLQQDSRGSTLKEKDQQWMGLPISNPVTFPSIDSLMIHLLRASRGHHCPSLHLKMLHRKVSIGGISLSVLI